jgi:RimJ/RimL family protein N-acetyltransferase
LRDVGEASIEAGPITLRPWRPEDVAFVFEACQDDEIHRWTPLPRPYRPSDAVALLRLSEEGRATNAAALFAITVTETGELVGSIGLKEIDWEHGRAEAGYWMAREARGRGLAIVALRALTAWAGEHLGLAEVWLQVAAGNEASLRAAERAGYERDGVVPGGCATAVGAQDAVVLRRATR